MIYPKKSCITPKKIYLKIGTTYTEEPDTSEILVNDAWKSKLPQSCLLTNLIFFQLLLHFFVYVEEWRETRFCIVKTFSYKICTCSKWINTEGQVERLLTSYLSNSFRMFLFSFNTGQTFSNNIRNSRRNCAKENFDMILPFFVLLLLKIGKIDFELFKRTWKMQFKLALDTYKLQGSFLDFYIIQS